MRLPDYEEKPKNSYGGLGRALLEKMGWKSGKGLGKNEDGIAEALAPKKKEDAAGIGANNRYPWEMKLWEKSFSQALSKLNGICDSSSDSDGDDSSSDSDSDDANKKSDGEIFETIRYGEVAGRDGIAVSGSKAELMIAKELAKDKWGRWGGREGKMARIAQAEAKAAAELGLEPPPRSAFAPGQGGGEESPSGSDSDAPRAAKRETKGKKEKKGKKKKAPAEEEEEEGAGGKERGKEKEKKQKKKKGKQSESESESDEPAAASCGKRSRAAAEADDSDNGDEAGARKKQKAAAGASGGEGAARGADGPAGTSGGVAGLLSQAAAWWSKTFVHAGNLEGLRTKKNQKRGFNEDDQENLYMKAHDGKAQGRLGLGVTSGSNPMKVAGARWKGKKVSFGNEGDADGSGGAEAEEEPAVEPEGGAGGKQRRKAGRGGGGGGGGEAADWGKVKWKGISEALLKEHAAGAKGMKLSKLRSLAVQRAEESLGVAAGEGGELAEAAFDSRVLKSSRFEVQGKRIALSTDGGGDAAGEEGAAGAEEGDAEQPKKKKSKKSSGKN